MVFSGLPNLMRPNGKPDSTDATPHEMAKAMLEADPNATEMTPEEIAEMFGGWPGGSTPYETAKAFLDAWPGAEEASATDFADEEHELIFISPNHRPRKE